MFLYSYIVTLPRESDLHVAALDPAEVEAIEQGAFAQRGAAQRFLWKHLLKPLLDLLRMGATPQKLAWSMAVGAALGTMPILGVSSLACLGTAFLFRLNVVATQIMNHLVFPIQLALLVIFLGAGDRLFHTAAHSPMNRDAFAHALHGHDWATAHRLWTWEWHALLVWLAAAIVLTPLAAFALRPSLEALLDGLQHQPIMEK
jgi:uncharacterized protein (DUF2062 family)